IVVSLDALPPEEARVGLKAGGWRLEAGGWRLEAGGWRLEAGGWRLDSMRAPTPNPIKLFRPAFQPQALLSALPLRQQVPQVDDSGIGTGNVIGHHQRVVGQHTIAAAIEHHRAPQRLLRSLQFTNDLPNADGGILLGQHVGE